MKKVIFSILLVVGFCFGFSSVMAQNSPGLATLMKTDGTVNTKEVVTAGISQKLPILYEELKVATPGQDYKLKHIEVLLYKGMLSNISAGNHVRNAYEASMQEFLNDYPYEFINSKKEVVDEFNEIVFIN